MPIIKSAKKRVRVAKKATIRNSKTKRIYRNAIKALETAISSKSPKVSDGLSKAQSSIDTAVKKGLLHKKTAARKKSRLAQNAKAAGVKMGAVKKQSAAKKTVTKKPAVKKAAKKKPATKKTGKSGK